MIEKKIEDDHVFQARKHGAVCIKGEIPGRAAYPDQLILKDNKRFYWVEFKVPGNNLQPDQEEMISLLRKKGHTVYVCDTMFDSNVILDAEFGS